MSQYYKKSLIMQCKCNATIEHSLPPTLELSPIICSNCEDVIGFSNYELAEILSIIEVIRKPSDYQVTSIESIEDGEKQ